MEIKKNDKFTVTIDDMVRRTHTVELSCFER